MTIHLTQKDREDISDAQSYLKLHADMDFEHLPEKTLAGLFNQLSPAARDYLRSQQQKVADFRESGGREMPFQQKRYLEDMNLPEHVQKTVAKSDTEDGIQSLHERMGTAEAQTRVNDRPASMRDHITAAFDAAQEDSNG